MLLRFAVGNFLSFKEVAEYKMAAGKATRHDSHVAKVGNGKRILKGGFIFGANASGKSNFIRAMEFAQKSILDSVSLGKCYKKHFRIDDDYKNKPGVFQFDILADGQFYSYGFSVSYTNAEVEEEWLFCINDSEKRIFERGRDKDGKMKIVSDIIFENTEEKTTFEVYSKAIDKGEMKRKMFLLDIAMRSDSDAECYKPFRDVVMWFENLRVIYPTSKYTGIHSFISDDDKRLTLSNLLNYFDTGIESVSRIKKSFEMVFKDMPEEAKISKKEKFLEKLQGQNSEITVSYAGMYYEVRLEDDELIVLEVVSDHGNSEDLFEYGDESDGTRRLFDLLPIFRRARLGCVIVIDELDRSLHTKVTVEFIKRFYKEVQGCNSQLIATTHDSNILDLDLLRQDEIWLVERMDDHSSALRPLSYYKPRFDKDVEKDYLIGRYGAVPIFNRLASLDDEGGAQDAR